MNDLQAFVEMINDRNVPDWRNYPIDHLVLGLFGERGEIANATKKFSRHKLGWVGGSYNEGEYETELKSELAGTAIYACLIAGRLGWDILDLVKQEVELLKKKFGWK